MGKLRLLIEVWNSTLKPSLVTNLIEWLSLAEYWFNSNFHTALKLTPFETLYGFPSPRSHTYVPGTTRVEALDSILQQRQEVLASLRCNLATT